MNLEIRQGVIEDLKQMDRENQKRIKSEIEKLKHEQLNENTSLINK